VVEGGCKKKKEDAAMKDATGGKKSQEAKRLADRKKGGKAGRDRRKPRVATGRAEGEQAPLSLEELLRGLAAKTCATLREVCVAAGFQVLMAMLQEDVEKLCGPRYRHHDGFEGQRYGQVPGEVTLGGRKVGIERPRVRAKAGREIPLPRYVQYSREDPLTQETMDLLLAGVATRNYAQALETVDESLDVRAVSRSAVSRRFVAATQAKLEEWQTRPLGEPDLVALMLDGLSMKDTTVLVALGIDATGKKHLLGCREGSTENATVCREMLANLVERGLRTDQPILVVLDGGKALRKAVREVFGRNAIIQRCQVHKIRNVLDHLPKSKRATVRRKMNEAYAKTDFAAAKEALLSLDRNLAKGHPGAAESLREGLDETLTVLGLDISIRSSLRKTLVTTNPIESTLSTVRRVCRNVKRWRNGAMALRWTVTGLLEAQKSFRRLKGMADMPKLVQALRGNTESQAA
jgi:putative transposase